MEGGRALKFGEAFGEGGKRRARSLVIMGGHVDRKVEVLSHLMHDVKITRVGERMKFDEMIKARKINGAVKLGKGVEEGSDGLFDLGKVV